MATKKYTWKDPRGLTTAVTLVMAFDVLWHAARIAIHLYWGPRADLQGGGDLTAPQLVNGLHALLAIPMLLLLIVPLFWILQVSKNAHVLKGRKLENSPMFAALWWWIIPFMSLFKPVASISEIWDVSAAEPQSRKRGRVLLPIWWGATLIANALSVAANSLGRYPETAASAPTMESLQSAVAIVQGLAFIAIVQRIAALQVQKRLVSEFSDVEMAPGVLEGVAG